MACFRVGSTPPPQRLYIILKSFLNPNYKSGATAKSYPPPPWQKPKYATEYQHIYFRSIPRTEASASCEKYIMTMKYIWITILLLLLLYWQCNVLQQAYELYDGFVVLHGTDTLAYTASALSFMFENLGKTIIITGAQVINYYYYYITLKILWTMSL